jgi:hypothetical protein
MLQLGKLININNNKIKWIGKDTVAVQVGDQIDRCRPINGLMCDNPLTTDDDEASDIKILELFTDLDAQAREKGGMVISLLGNHELMNVMGDMRYVSYKGLEQFENHKFNNNADARKYAFAPGNKYGNFLGCTRLPAVIIGNNLFVHAGIVTKLIEHLNINKSSDLENVNIAIKKWLLGLVNKDYVADIINSSKYSIGIEY